METNQSDIASLKRTHHLMNELMTTMRTDLQQITDPQARAILETSAEVITALIKTIRDYESKHEEAWYGDNTVERVR